MTTALLLVDIQNDYFPGGRLELDRMTEAAAMAGGLLATFRQKEQPIFHVRHLSLDDDAGFFIPGTEGCEINSSVTSNSGEPVVEKNAPTASSAPTWKPGCATVASRTWSSSAP